MNESELSRDLLLSYVLTILLWTSAHVYYFRKSSFTVKSIATFFPTLLAVVNLSFGFDKSQTLSQWVNEVVFDRNRWLQLTSPVLITSFLIRRSDPLWIRNVSVVT